MLSLPRLGCSAVMVAALLVTSAQAQLNDLSRYIPSDANVIMVVDVERLHASEYGQKNDWDGSHQQAFDDGLTMVPPDSLYFLLTSQVDYDYMESMWTVALAQMSRNVTMEEVAAKRFGAVDTVAEKACAMLPDDRIIVELSPGFYGAIAPGNRQEASRWIRSGDAASKPMVTPYLEEAISRVSEIGTPIVMAMDLEYIMSQKLIRERLDRSEIMSKRDDIDKDELAGVLSGIRGVTMSVEMENIPKGTITVDFNRDCSILRGFGKFLLIEALANNGAFIDDFDSWQVSHEENKMILKGGLSASGMRRIFSILDQPVAGNQVVSQSGGGGGADSGSSDEQRMMVATKQYFDSVQTLLDDLGSHKGTARSWGQIGLWFDKYADKIDRLGVLNVDQQMVEYGTFVSQQLRVASMGIKQGNINTGTRQRQVWNTGSNNNAPYMSSGYWGGGGVAYGYRMGNPWDYNQGAREVDAERRAIRSQEKARSASSAQNILMEIRNVTGEIRRNMTQKYQVEF